MLQAATLVAAVVASRAHAWVIRLTVAASLLLVAGAIAAVVGTSEFGRDSAHLISLLLVALAPPAIISALIGDVRQERRVTIHTMFGVLCLYLLIGLLFASVFAAIQEVFNVEFFRGPPRRLPRRLPLLQLRPLTTVGYGDLVAATDVGRSLAITEALIGQIYLVTVVALIMGNIVRPPALRLARSQRQQAGGLWLGRASRAGVAGGSRVGRRPHDQVLLHRQRDHAEIICRDGVEEGAEGAVGHDVVGRPNLHGHRRPVRVDVDRDLGVWLHRR